MGKETYLDFPFRRSVVRADAGADERRRTRDERPPDHHNRIQICPGRSTENRAVDHLRRREHPDLGSAGSHASYASLRRRGSYPSTSAASACAPYFSCSGTRPRTSKRTDRPPNLIAELFNDDRSLLFSFLLHLSIFVYLSCNYESCANKY